MKCLHTTILVSDLARSQYFYETILGLQQTRRSLNFPGVWYQIGDYQIHLVVDINYKNTRINADKWGRNPHIALGVNNLQDTISYLESQSYIFQRSASGRPALFLQDPDGNTIEITHIN
ncbi:MAG: VOC family protein [Chlorogloea purpurea SAG 13.99]|nr:VOC family protein [Chlorogloea purpurea SAG 13.99]